MRHQGPIMLRLIAAYLERRARSASTATVPREGVLSGPAFLVLPDLGVVRRWEVDAMLAPGDSLTIKADFTITCDDGTGATAATPAA